MPRIVIGGDVMPGGINEAAFQNGDGEVIVDDLLPVFQSSDLTIVNLESPLLKSCSPVPKSGPVLGVPESCVAGLKAIGIHVVGLANNHTMDHGESGLQNTLNVCSAVDINCVGAGENLQAASRIVIRNVEGYRVGILALAEHEFGIATRSGSGVCPLDPVVFSRAIFAQKDEYDSLIVMIHGGNEFYRFPRPSLQQTCRFLIELGADLVVCQHSHIVGCYEEYRGRYIVYGQGNFICAGDNKPTFWNEGLLIRLDLEKGRAPKFFVIPIVQSLGGEPGARSMHGGQLHDFQRQLLERCDEVTDSFAVERHWDDFCEQQRVLYLRRFGAPHRAFRLLDRYTGVIQYLLRRPRIRLDQLNLVRCESHREVLINLLDRK
jgi:poly-gamma-glutamate synthesis protein (capsule biosynthesis protein)